MTISIPNAVKQMLGIVEKLCIAYPHKKFTLDGRLVGDIGEVLVEEAYDLKLYREIQKHHDGECSKGRCVQIKATMKKSLTFPADHVPDFYLGVQVGSDGSFVEVFNGPGKIAWQAVMNRSRPKTNLYSIPVAMLKKLQEQVLAGDRIPLRKKTAIKPTIPRKS
jgi:hypothetical protein